MIWLTALTCVLYCNDSIPSIRLRQTCSVGHVYVFNMCKYIPTYIPIHVSEWVFWLWSNVFITFVGGRWWKVLIVIFSLNMHKRKYNNTRKQKHHFSKSPPMIYIRFNVYCTRSEWKSNYYWCNFMSHFYHFVVMRKEQ